MMNLRQVTLLFTLIELIMPSHIQAAESPAPTPTEVSAPPASSTAMPEEFTDYTLLSHKVLLQNVRAGNQDDSGINDYYFTTKIVGLVVDSNQEANKEEKSVTLDEVNFGSLQLKALDHWESNPKLKKDIAADINGDEIRKVISQVMLKFTADEKNIAVRIDLTLYEKNRKFYFLGEDQKVSTISYFPVPAKGAFARLRQDDLLQLQDGKSTLVNFAIKYKTPLIVEKKLGTSAPNVSNKQ